MMCGYGYGYVCVMYVPTVCSVARQRQMNERYYCMIRARGICEKLAGVPT